MIKCTFSSFFQSFTLRVWDSGLYIPLLQSNTMIIQKPTEGNKHLKFLDLIISLHKMIEVKFLFFLVFLNIISLIFIIKITRKFLNYFPIKVSIYIKLNRDCIQDKMIYFYIKKNIHLRIISKNTILEILFAMYEFIKKN